MISTLDSKYFKLATAGKSLKKDTANELSCSCTVCSDTKHRLHLVYVADGGYSYVKCFNSGCELENPVSMYKFLDISSPELYTAYKRENFKGVINKLKEEKSITDIMNEAKQRKQDLIDKKSQNKPKEIPLKKLFTNISEFPEALKYLKNRNITPGDDWYFSKQKFFEFEGKMVYLLDFILIPIYNSDFKYKGFYSRSIHEKQFSTFLLPDVEKLWVQNPEKTPDIICEGIFDAISSGFDNPSAMLGSGLSKDYISELSRETVIATDNDQTGVHKAYEFLELGFKVFIWPEVKYKDFNEMNIDLTQKQIKNFINDNTYQGIMGKIKLGLKEK